MESRGSSLRRRWPGRQGCAVGKEVVIRSSFLEGEGVRPLWGNHIYQRSYSRGNKNEEAAGIQLQQPEQAVDAGRSSMFASSTA